MQRHPFLDQLLTGVGGLAVEDEVALHGGIDARDSHDLLQVRRKIVPDVPVDHDLATGDRLVHAGRIVVLGDIVQAELAILDTVDPLGALDDATLQRRHDLAARQRHHRDAEPAVGLRPDAVDPVLHALEIVEAGDRLLEPAETLRVVGGHREAHEVHLQDVAVELLQESHAAAIVVPGPVVHPVHAEQRPVRQRNAGEALAEDVPEGRRAHVQDPTGHAVEDLERRDHRARRQGLDLHPAAGHLLHRLGPLHEQQVEVGRRRVRGLARQDQRIFHGLRRRRAG